jgi:hypothetical protein
VALFAVAEILKGAQINEGFVSVSKGVVVVAIVLEKNSDFEIGTTIGLPQHVWKKIMFSTRRIMSSTMGKRQRYKNTNDNKK